MSFLPFEGTQKGLWAGSLGFSGVIHSGLIFALLTSPIPFLPEGLGAEDEDETELFVSLEILDAGVITDLDPITGAAIDPEDQPGLIPENAVEELVDALDTDNLTPTDDATLPIDGEDVAALQPEITEPDAPALEETLSEDDTLTDLETVVETLPEVGEIDAPEIETIDETLQDDTEIETAEVETPEDTLPDATLPEEAIAEVEEIETAEDIVDELAPEDVAIADPEPGAEDLETALLVPTETEADVLEGTELPPEPEPTVIAEPDLQADVAPEPELADVVETPEDALVEVAPPTAPEPAPAPSDDLATLEDSPLVPEVAPIAPTPEPEAPTGLVLEDLNTPVEEQFISPIEGTEGGGGFGVAVAPAPALENPGLVDLAPDSAIQGEVLAALPEEVVVPPETIQPDLTQPDVTEPQIAQPDVVETTPPAAVLDALPGEDTATAPDDTPDPTPTPQGDEAGQQDEQIAALAERDPEAQQSEADEFTRGAPDGTETTTEAPPAAPDGGTSIRQVISQPTAQTVGLGQMLRRIRATPSPQCTLLLPRLAGESGLGIALIGEDEVALNALADGVTETVSLDVVRSIETIDGRQCAVLDAVRQASSYPASRLGIAIENAELTSGDSLRARIIGAGGLYLTLVLIDDNGVVQDLNRFTTLEDNVPVIDAPIARSGPPRASRQILLAMGSPSAPIDVEEQLGSIAQDVFAVIEGQTLNSMVFGLATFDVR